VTAPPGPLEARLRLSLALVSCVLVALPFLAVSYPPITDLPQHTAQVRLFLETHFDYAIVAASAEVHAQLPERLPVTPVTTAGTWRLYRVRR
jgi:hypothetical protein